MIRAVRRCRSTTRPRSNVPGSSTANFNDGPPRSFRYNKTEGSVARFSPHRHAVATRTATSTSTNISFESYALNF